MASQTNTKRLIYLGLPIFLLVLALTPSVTAKFADWIKTKNNEAAEWTDDKRSLRSDDLLALELNELLKYTELLRKALARQEVTWPSSDNTQCPLRSGRDSDYDENQDLTNNIDKLLNKYPRCGYTRQSLTDSYAYDEPEEVFSTDARKRRSIDTNKNVKKRSVSAAEKSSQTRIFGGHMTRVGEWPWLAAFGLKDAGPQCGGTLIADRWILTAAHCFSEREMACKFNVRLGARNWKFGDSGNTPEDRNVEAIYIHPKYDDATTANDVALLKLSSPVNMDERSAINAVCLSKQSQPVQVGTVCHAAGWGLLETNSTITVLNSRQVELPVVSYGDPCGDWQDGLMKPGMLCAGYLDGGKDTCQGDSGGPLIYKSGDQWTQIGLTSFGGVCGKERFPGIYTDVGYYLHWITSVITRNSDTLQ